MDIDNIKLKWIVIGIIVLIILSPAVIFTLIIYKLAVPKENVECPQPIKETIEKIIYVNNASNITYITNTSSVNNTKIIYLQNYTTVIERQIIYQTETLNETLVKKLKGFDGSQCKNTGCAYGYDLCRRDFYGALDIILPRYSTTPKRNYDPSFEMSNLTNFQPLKDSFGEYIELFNSSWRVNLMINETLLNTTILNISNCYPTKVYPDKCMKEDFKPYDCTMNESVFMYNLVEKDKIILRRV